ncbi:hypothetical protein DXG03_009310 [Asterophora parasitica]|uniref:Uncharacterized protein n=1 Tax=Asterophora parasitica TaxID=117018 RepID=A0A9P7G4Y9_9AGAR|nr:hypothetical protein DXG03_009310 [Asterophora parasitica]
MKVIQAFSWALFIILTLAFLILFRLATHAQMFGRMDIWREPIREMPWFGEAPGFYNQGMMVPGGFNGGQYPGGGYPYPPPMSASSHAGQTIVVQPGLNGQPATITRVPMA